MKSNIDKEENGSSFDGENEASLDECTSSGVSNFPSHPGIFAPLCCICI